MKKQLLKMSLAKVVTGIIFSAFSVGINAQYPPIQVSVIINSYLGSNLCLPGGTGRLGGTVGFSLLEPYVVGDNNHDPCGGAATVSLLRATTATGTYSTVSMINNVANGSSFNFTITQGGYYKVSAAFNSTSVCLANSGTSSVYDFIGREKASISSFKIDGNAVNTSTYLTRYTCQDINITNIVWAGSPDYTPEYKIDATKGSATKSTGWVSGTPPSTYPLKLFLGLSFGGLSAMVGNYTITISVRNGCGTVSSTSCLLRVASGAKFSACFKLANNSLLGCSGTNVSLVYPGGAQRGLSSSPAIDCSLPVQPTCGNSPKLTTTCSTNGDFIDATWAILVIEYDNTTTCTATAIPIWKSGTLTNASDISCFSLNDISNPLGFFYNNSSGKKYYVIFELKNVCGASYATGWFTDNQGGCKTDGSEDVSGLEELSDDEQLQVFPNPASSELNLYYKDNSDLDVKFNVTDISGRKIDIYPTSRETGKATFNIASLAKGTYIMEVNNNEGYKFSKRFVVE